MSLRGFAGLCMLGNTNCENSGPSISRQRYQSGSSTLGHESFSSTKSTSFGSRNSRWRSSSLPEPCLCNRPHLRSKNRSDRVALQFLMCTCSQHAGRRLPAPGGCEGRCSFIASGRGGRTVDDDPRRFGFQSWAQVPESLRQRAGHNSEHESGRGQSGRRFRS